jgi:hypothetical protein
MKIKLALLAGLALLLSGCVSTSGYSGYSSGRYYNVTEYDDYSYDDAYYGPRPLFNEFSPQYFDSWSSYRRQACYFEGRYCDGYSYYHRSPSSHFDFYIASYPRYSNISECLWYSRDPWPCYRFAFLGYDPYYFDRRGYYYGYGRHSIFYHRPYRGHHYNTPRHPPGRNDHHSYPPVAGNAPAPWPQNPQAPRQLPPQKRQPYGIQPRQPVLIRPEPQLKVRDDSRMNRMPVIREPTPASRAAPAFNPPKPEPQAQPRVRLVDERESVEQ